MMKRLLAPVLLSLFLLAACGGAQEETASEAPPSLGGFGTGPVETVQEEPVLPASDGGEEETEEPAALPIPRPAREENQRTDGRTLDAMPPGAAENGEDDPSAWTAPDQQEDGPWKYQPEDSLWYCWNEEGLWCYWEETGYWYYRDNDDAWFYLAVDGYWYPCREDLPVDEEGDGAASQTYGGSGWDRQDSYDWYGRQDDPYDPYGRDSQEDPWSWSYQGPQEDDAYPFWPIRGGQARVDPASVTYIVNTGTMRFHALDCPAVSDIQARNRQAWTGTREELIAEGYRPCGTCRP